jgi:hypothetical protein
MASQAKRPVEKVQLKTPDKFDLEKGLKRAKELMRENKEWVKEMAKK